MKKILHLCLKIIGCLFLATLLPVIFFRFFPVPYSSYMVQQKISAMKSGKKFEIKHKWVSFDTMSPCLTLAVICAEDQLFEKHHGFDMAAVEKAFKRNSKKRVKRIHGASTITQQMVKNLFLWPSRTYFRKGVEAYFTLLVELLWSKQRVMEVYLNIIELGYGVFGVEAAAQKYFGINSSKISLEKAALFAAVLPNPVKYRIDKPSWYVVRRKNWILQQCSLYGGINNLTIIER